MIFSSTFATSLSSITGDILSRQTTLPNFNLPAVSSLIAVFELHSFRLRVPTRLPESLYYKLLPCRRFELFLGPLRSTLRRSFNFFTSVEIGFGACCTLLSTHAFRWECPAIIWKNCSLPLLLFQNLPPYEFWGSVIYVPCVTFALFSIFPSFVQSPLRAEQEIIRLYSNTVLCFVFK